MVSKPPYYLVDTNVWVDSYLGNRPGSKESRAFIVAARSSGAELLYSIVSIKDVFYLVANSLKRQEREEKGELSQQMAMAIEETAWGCARNMSENATAVGADESDVWLALKLKPLHNDLEDNLVLAAAERANVDMLVTNDKALLLKSTVQSHTPADAIALIGAQSSGATN